MCDHSPRCQRGWEICDTAGPLIASLSARSPLQLSSAPLPHLLPWPPPASLPDSTCRGETRPEVREESARGPAAGVRGPGQPSVGTATLQVDHSGGCRPSHACEKTHSPRSLCTRDMHTFPNKAATLAGYRKAMLLSQRKLKRPCKVSWLRFREAGNQRRRNPWAVRKGN